MDLSIPHALRNYIGGRFSLPQNGSYLQSINPATGELICYVPDSDEADLEDAVRCAQAAFPAWNAVSPEERFSILNLIASLLQEHCEAFAIAETKDAGKPLWISRKNDIPRAAANFRSYASAIMQFSSESHSLNQHEIQYTLRQPIGIVGCIAPENLPFYLFTSKMAAALAAGNCVIAKPSELTPVTTYLLSVVCQEAGLPGGVLNILHGTSSGCGESIVKHPAIKAVSFTGAVKTGRYIAALAAPMFKKLSLELGGKNPNIIFADCDWEKTLSATLKSAFSNQGQISLGGSRILVEKSIYNQFKTAFVEAASKLSTGDPFSTKSYVGALTSKKQLDELLNSIDEAIAEGGKLLLGGKSIQIEDPYQNGLFVTPTIIEGLGPNAQINQNEIFGPVVTLQSFESNEQLIALANASGYGLAATIWTADVSKANRLAAQLDCGIIWINCWMQQDVRSSSSDSRSAGLSRQGGLASIQFFTESKNICIHY